MKLVVNAGGSGSNIIRIYALLFQSEVNINISQIHGLHESEVKFYTQNGSLFLCLVFRLS